MLCTVLGLGLERGDKTGYLIPANHCLHLRHIFSTPFSLPMTAVREVSQQLLIPQHHFPKLLMKQVLNRRTDTRNDFFLSTSLPLASLPGLQIIFPQYLQEKFVQSALSYIMCNGEGEYICRNSQCGCQCAEEFPQCNCPITDIQIMEYTLANMAKSWTEAYKDLENSGNQAKLTLQLISFKHNLSVYTS